MEEMNYRDSNFSIEGFEDYNSPAGAFVDSQSNNEYCAYTNAATCPECESGMVRMGNCFNCPSCGFGSCGI
ncbi:MAG: hypothetical protein ACE5DO_06795 [Desulfobacterales bacterium]